MKQYNGGGSMNMRGEHGRDAYQQVLEGMLDMDCELLNEHTYIH